MERLSIVGGGTFFLFYWWWDKAPRSFHIFWTGFGILLELSLVALVAWGAWRIVRIVYPVLKGWVEAVIRAYYFAFHPHPASPIVQAAIGSGAIIDGHALAGALGELPSDNRLLRAVRMEQASRLVSQMQEVSRRRVAEMERHAVADYERAAVVNSQNAIAHAALAFEKARAAYDASQFGGLKLE